MAFSKEWDTAYKSGTHNSVWPWSDVVSLSKRNFKGRLHEIRVLEIGCGAGANIPFFLDEGSEYCGIDGSETEVSMLNQKFAGKNVNIKCGDFTKEIPFDGSFDLVIDRSSGTHNSERDIRHMIELVYDKMAPGALYFGIDWFSLNYGHSNTDGDVFEQVDDYTRVFSSGRFEGLGNVHFSDDKHIKDLFSGMEIITLYEKTEKWYEPDEKLMGWWNFVAKKN